MHRSQSLIRGTDMWQWIKGGISYSDGTMDTELMMGIGTVLTFLGTSVYAVYSGQHWDPKDFGFGVAGVFGGIAAVLKFRKVD